MTPKLRQIFRYEVCIIPKDMKIYLNRFRTILVTDLHQKYVGSHKHNSLFSTTSASYYKYNMLTYGEFLYANIKDADQCITCLHIKPNNMVHIKCALGFCDKFPEYNISDEELYDGPNSPIIHFRVYTYQVRCATHGIITNGPSVCRSCE